MYFFLSDFAADAAFSRRVLRWRHHTLPYTYYVSEIVLSIGLVPAGGWSRSMLKCLEQMLKW